MKALGPVAIVLLVVVFIISVGALVAGTFFGMTVERSISARETDVLHAINMLEFVKEGLPYALEYSFYQAVYDVSKNGGYLYVPNNIPMYNNLPVWRKYDEVYRPSFIDEVIKGVKNYLNRYRDQVPDVSIPQYTEVKIVCGGKIDYSYIFNKPSTCYSSLITLRQVGDIAWIGGGLLYGFGSCNSLFYQPDCAGTSGNVGSDTIKYNTGLCTDEYYLPGDSEDYIVSAAEVNNHAYIFASGEPKPEESWAIECCFSGSGASDCNSDSTEGQRFHANNILSVETKNLIDLNGASADEVVQKFNNAWCGHKDRSCLLCHVDVKDNSKTKWYVCEGGQVEAGYGVEVIKRGERVGDFECSEDGQWTVGLPTCSQNIFTLRAYSNGLISRTGHEYTAYENPNVSKVVESNIYNVLSVVQKNFIEKDRVRESIINVISDNGFTCNSDNQTVKNAITSALTTNFKEGDIQVIITPIQISISLQCNSTVAAIVQVQVIEPLRYIVFDGTLAYRNPTLRFYVITSNDYDFRPFE